MYLWEDKMIKKIFCLCFVLIALIGIFGISACHANNCTVVGSNSGLSLADSVQSVDDGFELLNDQALEERDDIDFKSGMVSDLNGDVSSAERDDIDFKSGMISDLNEDVSQDNCISIPNDDNASLDGVDESAIDLKDDGFIINAAKDAKSKIPSTFMPVFVNKELFAIEFDPETGIVKVNQNCPYVNTAYINSSAPVLWHVCVDNHAYQKEYHTYCDDGFEIGDAYPNCISNQFNLTACITDHCLDTLYTDGHFKCNLSFDVLRDKDYGIDFSVDFIFPLVVDDFNNLKYCGLEESIVHVSGKDFTIYDSNDIMMRYGRLYYNPKIDKIIKEENLAFCNDLVRYLNTVIRSIDLATINNLSNATLS